MDIGSICLCLTVGALIVFASIGIGVCIGDDRIFKRCVNGILGHTISRRDGVRAGSSSGSDNNRTFEQTFKKRSTMSLSNEELAVIVDGIIITGISSTSFEKACLKEAAERLRGDVDDGK